MVQQPSQYECDNIEAGDIVFVRQVNPLYRLFRKYFLKDLNKIKIRENWSEPVKYNEYYQEDCTLIYAYELACVQRFKNEVPCTKSRKIGIKKQKTVFLPEVQIGLYNLQIQLDKCHTITIPMSYITKAIDSNKNTLKSFDNSRKIQDAIRFQKYKGEYFSEYVKKHGITEWTPLYCSICGKPVVFNFSNDYISIQNNCECKALNFPLDKISYDEFALWYSNQIINSSVINRYNNFWFRRDDSYE